MKSFKVQIKEYFELIKFEHTIFALPFALSGMLLADLNNFPSLMTFFWVIIAMVGGRTAAMALNRVIDSEIDKLNPRTSQRAIPDGRIKKVSAIFLALVSFAAMILATLQLPVLCIKLLPLAILILVLYSYTKRFTKLSHLVLGSALGAAASGGWIAVSGTFTIPVLLWGIAIVFWVGGFDIIYAIQDIEFDRRHKLFSIPAAVGVKKSLLISKIFHIITVSTLILLGSIYLINSFLGYSYWIAVLFISLMLIYEHYLLKDKNLANINPAFFNVNGYISIGFMLFILIGKLLS